MSGPVLPPNPSLLAIMLVIKTGEGVKRVFQYPAEPGKSKPVQKPREETSNDDDSHSSDSPLSDPYEDYFSGKTEAHGPSRVPTEETEAFISDTEEARKARPPKHWKSYLRLPPDFDQVLCPPPSYHKKRFELGFEELVLLGWPVFAQKDGEWKKRKKRPSSGVLRRMSTIGEQAPEGNDGMTPVELDDELGNPTENESTDDHDEAVTESAALRVAEDQVLKTLIEEPRITSSTGTTLNMFHVVFVLNPPVLEYQLRVDDMYRHVVKKFSRALKWEQGRSNFVLRECEKLRAMKAKRDPLSQSVLRASPLARAIATLYTYISTSRIAHIDLSASLSFSLQIPIPTSLASLPDLISPQLPGLLLTTSHLPAPTDADAHPNPLPRLAPHLALILLTDSNNLLADLASPPPTATNPRPQPSPLAGLLSRYLRHTSPTKSVQQVAQAASLPVGDALFLAAHLVYWRKAHALPPLHARGIYVPSPNADGKRLQTAVAAYARLFPPPLPSMPQLLALLGAAGPRPYASTIPSKDHRPVYFDMLAWLLRGGWVTQLRAFGWVRVSGEIQAQVAREDTKSSSVQTASTGSAKQKPTSPIPATGKMGAHSAGDLDPVASGRRSPSASSLSSARTTVPHSSVLPARSSVLPSNSTLSTPRPPPARIIQHPTRAAGADARQLAVVAALVEAHEGPESRAAWERCVRYFDGAHALDKIAAREGWKRKAVEARRAAWVRLGVLIEVRFW